MGRGRTVRLIEPESGQPLFLAFVNARMTETILPVSDAVALKSGGSVAKSGDDAPFVRLGYRASKDADLTDDEKQVQQYLLDVMHWRLHMSSDGPGLEHIETITLDKIVKIKNQILRIAQVWSDARRKPHRNWDQEGELLGGINLAKELLKDAMGLLTLTLEVNELEPAIVPRRRGRPKSCEAKRRGEIALADTTFFTPFWSLYQFFRDHPKSFLRQCSLGLTDEEIEVQDNADGSSANDRCERWFMAKKSDHKFCSPRCRVRHNTMRICTGPDGLNAQRTKKWRIQEENENYFTERYKRIKGQHSSDEGSGR